jgi:hypothetical protein
MKCSKCGASLKDIKAMGAHYRKHHPAAMKHKGSRKPRSTGKRGLKAVMQGLRDKGYTEREIMNAYYDE